MPPVIDDLGVARHTSFVDKDFSFDALGAASAANAALAWVKMLRTGAFGAVWATLTDEFRLEMGSGLDS